MGNATGVREIGLIRGWAASAVDEALGRAESPERMACRASREPRWSPVERRWFREAYLEGYALYLEGCWQDGTPRD